ncbi:LuxR C-terminal-related transcriptional regulator [Amycolatopsis sp. NPDC059657]|uniref:LuxR C-terminal-related transcriptional regulator n=1 Tax=Amycolatopsis sp. NPDC059657 TaxID=3346899 RepID=UPI00366C8C15
MPRDHVAIVGRQAELAAVDEYAEAATLILLRGNIGTGKTTLLSEVARGWRARGITVLRIGDLGTVPDWDSFATRALIQAIRNNFHEIGDSRVAAALRAVTRSSDSEVYASARERSVLFADVVRLFRCLRANGPVAVLVDDVHTAPNPELAVAAAQQAGCTVVAACCEDGITAEPTSLSTIASRVFDLAPLPDEQVGELLAAVAPGRLDESVAPALSTCLGSLAGNPGAVLGTFEKLIEDGRFTEVQGYLCLRDPAAPVALPAGHHLVRHLARFGEPGRQLVALVSGADRFSVDDLLTFAAATGRELGHCGRMIDDLVAAGALDYDDDGIVNVTCPALAAATLDELSADGVASLHRVLAEHLLHDEHAHPVEPAVVADHIALAGAALAPDVALVPILEREAVRVLWVNPLLAARWYRAALRHCRPGGPERGRILGAVLRFLVRGAHYRCLNEVVGEAVADGVDDERRYELAASAALAAVHTGVPVPAPVYSALATDARGRAPLEIASAWFNGRESFTGEELEAAFGAFRVDERKPVEAVCGQDDLITMFKSVLGSAYGEPQCGPLAIFRRVIRNYGSGDWSGIPSDVRQLELAGSVETAQQQIARLLVAEVLASMGDYDGATEWVAVSGERGMFPALRAWVEIGIGYRSGEWDRYAERGWAAYGEIAAKVGEDSELGLRSFLVRLASLEMQAGNTEKLRAIRDDTKRWHARYGGESLRLAELMLRGLVDQDYAAATEAVEVVRKRDDLSELMRALMIVAFAAKEPRPWYHEAYEIARRLGGDWMRMNIKTFMRRDAVAAPSHRVDRELLTDVEKRVIELIQQGLTNRQIAGAVQVSEKTVENHLTRLFAKTGCRSRLDLATASLEGRLVVAEQGWAPLVDGKSG